MVTEAPNWQVEPGVTEDDEYSDDPQRRKAFWLSSANTEVERFLEGIHDPLATLRDRCAEALQSGGHEHWFLYAVEDIPPSNREQAAAVFDELRNIINEKGFRFGPALLTPREHDQIGSSGYSGIYWDTDPDIPVPLLRDRLIATGKITPEDEYGSELYTYDEVDRARRLMGDTTLDPQTHRVTDEIDEEAASDSYHFLSPDRREEVKAREAELLKEIDRLAKLALAEHATSREIVAYLAAYAEGQVTTPQIREQMEAVMSRASRNHTPYLDRTMSELRQLALETGKWDRILTPQEILLRSGGEVDPKYLSRPYTPLAVQDGASMEEIVALRQGESPIVVNATVLEYEMPFGFRLENLDDEGDTVKSPTFIDKNDEETIIETEEFRSYYVDRIKVPFAREDDWYYRS